MCYVSVEDTYEVVGRAHLDTRRGGRDRMLKELGKKYAIVTRDALEILILLPVVPKKLKRVMTKSVGRPILTNKFSPCAHIVLIDM